MQTRAIYIIVTASPLENSKWPNRMNGSHGPGAIANCRVKYREAGLH